MKNLTKKNFAEFIALCSQVDGKNVTWNTVAEFAQAHKITLPDGKPITAAYCSHIWPGLEDALSLKMLDLNTGDTPETIAAKASVNVENKENGEKTLDRLVVLYENADELTPERMLGFFKLNPEDWDIKSSKCNAWNGPTEEGKQLLYQLKITVAPKTAKTFSAEDFDRVLEKHNGKFTLPAVPVYKKSGKKVKRILEVDLADVHFGLLAWKPETGEHYDLDIAESHVLNAASELVARWHDRNLDEVRVVFLGDILHVDNANMTTVKGTKQDTEGRIPKMIDKATGALIQFIRTIETGIQVPVNVTYVPGNHDENLGYAVAKCVEMAFMADKNVSFDCGPAIFKVLEYGRTAVMVTHGDAPNKRLPNAFLTKFREEYGRNGEAEIHCGHLHSFAVDTQNPVSIFRVNAITAPSYWEESMAFPKHMRGLQTFLYETDTAGFIEIGNIYNK